MLLQAGYGVGSPLYAPRGIENVHVHLQRPQAGQHRLHRGRDSKDFRWASFFFVLILDFGASFYFTGVLVLFAFVFRLNMPKCARSVPSVSRGFVHFCDQLLYTACPAVESPRKTNMFVDGCCCSALLCLALLHSVILDLSEGHAPYQVYEFPCADAILSCLARRNPGSALLFKLSPACADLFCFDLLNTARL